MRHCVSPQVLTRKCAELEPAAAFAARAAPAARDLFAEAFPE
jgi:hypothetical protein